MNKVLFEDNSYETIKINNVVFLKSMLKTFPYFHGLYNIQLNCSEKTILLFKQALCNIPINWYDQNSDIIFECYSLSCSLNCDFITLEQIKEIYPYIKYTDCYKLLTIFPENISIDIQNYLFHLQRWENEQNEEA